LAIVGGTVVGILTALLTPLLPFLPDHSGPSGTLIVHSGNGQLEILDVTGTRAATAITLPPRQRADEPRKAVDPDIAFVSVVSVSWNSVSNVFLASAGLGDGRASEDALISYRNSGTPKSVVLRSTSETFDDVVVSPSGKLVAYTATPTGSLVRPRLVVREAGGRVERVLAEGRGPVTWSADDRFLAYQCFPSAGSPELCRFDRSSGRQEVVATPGFDNIQEPAISPDGKSIVYVGSAPGQAGAGLVLVNIRNGKARELVGDVQPKSYPRFDPGGRFVAFLTAGGVKIVNIRSGAVSVLVQFSEGEVGSTLQWVADPVAEVAF
jgi:dipeptidyl aminopeptidase/acylaminoacyl peptidase